MSKNLLRQAMVAAAEVCLAHQKPDGDMQGEPFFYFHPATWALCYTRPWPGNHLHRSARLRDAILRACDFNQSWAQAGNAHDEWRLFSWLQAMLALRDELDDARIAAWTKSFIAHGEWVLSHAIDMDVFDGGIPNHGIWNHVYTYTVGRLFERPDLMNMSADALARVMASQTADGVFREFQSLGGFQGTPVTGYNTVSAAALNVYHAISGDPRAAVALDRAWRWHYDFLLPDGSSPPNFDARMIYHEGPAMLRAAWFMNQPEGRHYANRNWAELAHKLAQPGATVLMANGGLAFTPLQFDQVLEEVAPREPAWPEYTRMLQGEACVRRRGPWAAALSGMTNYGESTTGLRFWVLERQDALALYHRDAGLVLGSSHSLIDPSFSTFVFFEAGRAEYLFQQSYLKSTPPLDTLLLRYGANVGAVSVDTTAPDVTKVILSVQGERGRRPDPVPGHALSAVAARCHLALRVGAGDTVRLGTQSWKLSAAPGEGLTLNVPAGETLTAGRLSIRCPETRWSFRYPVSTSDPYNPLQPGETLGLLEVVLSPRIWSDWAKPGPHTATFEVHVTT